MPLLAHLGQRIDRSVDGGRRREVLPPRCMGHFGDRFGRKKVLVLSLTMMGVATFIIGLLPTYEQIGV